MSNKIHHSHKEDAIKNRIHYWQRVKHMMEMHELKQKSIHFRKKLLEDRAKVNYQHEYDKIRGALAHTVVPIQSRRNLERRRDELISLGALAVGGIK